MKFIVQGRTSAGYNYDIKDGFRSLEDARTWRDSLKNGETTMPGGNAYNGKDTLRIASYEKRSYEATVVE